MLLIMNQTDEVQHSIHSDQYYPKHLYQMI